MKINSIKRITVAKVILWLTCGGALGGALGALPNLVMLTDHDAGPLAIWHFTGLLTFSALFALLALHPRVSKLLWIIIIGNKAVLCLLAVIMPVIASVQYYAGEMVFVDGILVVMLTAAYYLIYGEDLKKITQKS